MHKALRAACAATGRVDLREGAEAVALEVSPDGATVQSVRLASGGLLPACALFLCSGSWLRELVPVPLKPIKGQMLSLSPPGHQMPGRNPPPTAAAAASSSAAPSSSSSPSSSPSFSSSASRSSSPSALRRVLFGESVYIIPRRDGRIVVGATVEPEAGFCRRVTVGGVHHLLSEAIRTVPALAAYSLDETWAGLRPSTPDLLPVLGATPWENVHLAAGYHRNGVLLSPLCASLLADRVEGRLSPADDKLLGRFGWDRFMGPGAAAARGEAAAAAAGGMAAAATTTMEGDPGTSTTTTSGGGAASGGGDALHSTDGYAELTSQADDTRDDAIFAAAASNLRFKKSVLEDQDEAEIMRAVEADLERYRSGQPPQL